MKDFNVEIVKNPEIFQQNRLQAHSDHIWFTSPDARWGEEGSGRYSLNGCWKFMLAKNLRAVPQGFEQEEYDCRCWDSIPVPAHMQMEGYGTPQYVNTQYPWDGREEVRPGEIPEQTNPVGCYVDYFVLPEEMEDRRIYISFQGVESGFALWLNGHYAGYSEDSFTPAEFELTPWIRTGENKLALQVFTWTAGSWCEDQDFFRFSGIFRDVWLFTVPEVHIRDLRVRTLLDEPYTQAQLLVDLAATKKGRVRLTLLPAEEGKTPVFEEERMLDGETSCLFSVPSPRLWSAEDPYLYELRLDVYTTGGSYSETVIEKVGFRCFEMKDGLMCLNGKRIVFRGVNRHEFSSDTGRCIREEQIRQDLVTMKKNNINAVRTSHYPNQSVFYRLCDELGLYVIDEANVETHGIWDAIERGLEDQAFAVPGDRPEYLRMLLDRARSMFARDKNHPCILLWSCGNEAYGGSNFREMSRAFHTWDSTRLVHYEGISWDPRYPETSDVVSRMYWPADEIRSYLTAHREKPFISCEYAHAMGNSCGAMHKYTRLTREEPLYQGGFIWDYIDQSLTRTDRYGNEYQAYGGDFGDRPTDYQFCGNGIVYGGDRLPSPKMQEVRFLYQPVGITFREEEGTWTALVSNQNLFTCTDQYRCRLLLEREGRRIAQTDLTAAARPGRTKRVPLPVCVPETEGEYTLTLSFLLAADTSWAKAGHEISWGQLVLVREKDGTLRRRPLPADEQPEKTEAATACTGAGAQVRTEAAAACNEAGAQPARMEDQKKTQPERTGRMQVIRGWDNYGVKGEHFEALFSKRHGGLVSYRYGGRELLKDMPRPNFWRAMTDNDIACQLPFRAAQWKTAGVYAGHRFEHGRSETTCTLTELPGEAKVCYTLHLPTRPAHDCSLTYRVFPDGTIRVTLRMEAAPAIGQLPAFGMLLKLDACFDRLEWYGIGPEETYADRCHAKLGIWKRTALEDFARYLLPQECGNHMGVRWAKLTDRKGRGLLFETEGLELSALPWSPHELDNARHAFELPPVHYTYVRIGRQMGIGGDDTWGALVHPEYLLDQESAMEISFSFRGILE